MPKVKESVFDQPDVSKISPVPIPVNATRSPLMRITFINDYGRYEPTVGFWDDLFKVFRRTDGTKINYEIARTEAID